MRFLRLWIQSTAEQPGAAAEYHARRVAAHENVASVRMRQHRVRPSVKIPRLVGIVGQAGVDARFHVYAVIGFERIVFHEHAGAVNGAFLCNGLHSVGEIPARGRRW